MSSVVFSLKSVCKVDKVFYFQDNQWEIEVKSDTHSIVGQVLLKGSMEKTNASKVKVIYKTGVKVEDIVYSIHFIPDGLNINGIDRFESYQTVRLINSGMPKLVF
jgi:hypothetical protein